MKTKKQKKQKENYKKEAKKFGRRGSEKERSEKTVKRLDVTIVKKVFSYHVIPPNPHVFLYLNFVFRLALFQARISECSARYREIGTRAYVCNITSRGRTYSRGVINRS